MLMFTRRRGEGFRVGDDVIIKVTETRNDRVKIGIIAPAGVRVHREEVYREIQEHGHKNKKGDACKVQSDSQ